jgi:hypothetical protein
LIPVFSTTGESPEVGGLLAADPVDGCDEELDAALGACELDEQALRGMTAAINSASSAGRTRERARAT